MRRTMIALALGLGAGLGLAGCACPPKPVAAGVGSGTGTGTGTGTGSAATCEGVKAAVTALYDLEANGTHQADHDPTFVADNVEMVMKDCSKDPARVAGCAARAPNVAQLEHDCLIPLDEDGREGEELAR